MYKEALLKDSSQLLLDKDYWHLQKIISLTFFI